MKLSALDKFLVEVAPGYAFRRIADKSAIQEAQGSPMMYGPGTAYAGVIDTRRRTYQAWQRALVGTEEFALGEYDRDTLRLECRDLYRNNEIVRGAVNRFIEYAVWKGIKPQAHTRDEAWNQRAENWWNDIYSKTCDHRQLAGVDLVTLQKMVISHRMIDGDCGFILLQNGQIQPVESALIATPQKFAADESITQGIRRTKGGILTGYFVCPRSQGGAVDKSRSQFVRKENMLFCFEPDRIDQVRGVSRLAPAVAKLRDYDETDENVLNKIKLDAMQQFVRKVRKILPNQRGRGAYTKTNSDGKDQQRVEKQDWGRVHNIGVDEEMEAFEGKTPSREYVDYMKHELQAIAACLDIPYEFLMLIFTEGSFSSQRAALIHSKHIFTEWHDWVIKVFLQPLWNWRIAKAIKEGDLPPAPVDKNGRSEWWRVEWSLPFFDWVDPDKQAKADEKRYDMGATSLSAITKSQGREVRGVLSEKAADIRQAIEQANAINEANAGANVSWRDFIFTASAASTQPAQADVGIDDEDAEESNDNSTAGTGEGLQKWLT